MKIEPVQITIDICGKCNAECLFCLRNLGKDVPQGIMKKEVFYEIMRQVKEIKTIRIISLSAYGEAMLHPDFDEFVSYLNKLKYNILVITNMSLADSHYDSLLKLSHIIYSIEGYDKETYEKYRKNIDFNKVLQNIKDFDILVKQQRAKEQKTPTRLINCTCDKNTKINLFIEKWKNYTDSIVFNPIVRPISWNEQNKIFENVQVDGLEEILFECNKEATREICTQPFKTIVIHPDGTLALCCNDANCKMDFGNYKDIKSYFNNENFSKIRKELLANKPVICKNCTVNIKS